MLSKINPGAFSETLNGEQVSLHFLRNSNQIEVAITNYGARIVALIVPDRKKLPTDVVVGFDSLQGYLRSTETYHGAIVGRYANRIANGRFNLDGRTYQLAINMPPSHLHGGPKGFNNQVWRVDEVQNESIRLSYLSEDGEENYPGNLKLTVTYTLTDENALKIDYEATTDKATILNVTAHPFFNLNGQGKGTIENHLLQLNASKYTPVDETVIPTGVFTVEGTPFDFRKLKSIGQNINDDNEQLKYGAGYDHNFVLEGSGLRIAGRTIGDQSGIVMEVITDQPGMQLYTGNWMAGQNKIKYGFVDNRREAFCLETQHYPDSPNHPEFPTTVLRPGEVFRSTTIYKFSVTS
ncbi:MAG: aldose epimerase family protein [Flavisolibacter sp.]